jgi:hypothetical protein
MTFSCFDGEFLIAEGSATWLLWLTPSGKIAHVRWFFN